jgi:hypothetical protein
MVCGLVLLVLSSTCAAAKSRLGDVSLRSASRLTHLAQIAPTVREKLLGQTETEKRGRTMVRDPAASIPQVAAGAGQDPVQADKMRRVQQLLEDVEKEGGTEPGAVRIISKDIGEFALQYDLRKARSPSGILSIPFAKTLALPQLTTPQWAEAPLSQPWTVTAPAEVEYRVSADNSGREQVVAVAVGGSAEIAANAFRSGFAPVSLEVKTANLQARQVPGETGELPVIVTVGPEMRQMKPGEVARIGTTEVTIQASSNRSGDIANLEGPPYALRLQLRPLRN